jgi:hypothetical protein
MYTSTDSGVEWFVNSHMPPVQWTTVVVSSDGDRIVACGPNTYLYVSSNQGLTWDIHEAHGIKAWTALALSSDGLRLHASAYKDGIFSVTFEPPTFSPTYAPGSFPTYTPSSMPSIINTTSLHLRSSYMSDNMSVFGACLTFLIVFGGFYHFLSSKFSFKLYRTSIIVTFVSPISLFQIELWLTGKRSYDMYIQIPDHNDLMI